MPKARLVILGKPTKDPGQIASGKEAVEVDFNPATLKLSYQNKTEGGKTAKPSESQFVGSLDASLQVELVFDTTQPGGGENAGIDVRKKTKKIFNLLLPKDPKKPKSAPPVVRFEWGSFLFEGMMKSMNETLEYFSVEGIPLRSTVAVTITTTTDLMLFNDQIKKKPPSDFARTPPGTQPQTPVPPGDSLQKAAGRNGDSSDWRSIAQANNIDNPLRLPAGQPLNLNVTGGASAGIGGASVSGGIRVSGGAGVSAGAQASAGGGAILDANATANLDVRARR